MTFHPEKKKQKTKDVNTPSISADSTQVAIAFKLVSDQSDNTRCFPASECSTSRILFAKSRMFFRLIDAAAVASILSCRLPFQHERRHLFEGSEGEFAMLLADVRKLDSRGEDNLIVEIKCVT